MKNNILVLNFSNIAYSSNKLSAQKRKVKHQQTRLISPLIFKITMTNACSSSLLEATANGDNRYNDQLPIDISESYRMKVKAFYESQLKTLVCKTGSSSILMNKLVMTFKVGLAKWDRRIPVC